MIELSSAIVSTFTGLIGVIIGAIVNNYFTHKIARQAAKKDIIFKKEIEYFEKIVVTIENNKALYRKSLKKLEASSSKKEFLKILENLKKSRQKFQVMTSSLYLDIRPITFKIKQFVAIEKIIFSYFDKLNNSTYSKQELIIGLNLKLIEMNKVGDSLITLLREHLKKE